MNDQVSYDTLIPNNVGLSADKRTATGFGKLASEVPGLVDGLRAH